LGLKAVLIERGLFGGQMANAAQVENYPGFPDGIAGAQLGLYMHQQALNYGLESVTAEVLGLGNDPPYQVETTEGPAEAQTVIIATGSQYRTLGVAGEDELRGRGVSYCATCDGFFFRDRQVAVVGGGDTAVSDALELTRHASKVYLIHRRDQLRAGQVLQRRAFDEPRIEFVWSSVVDRILGDQSVEKLRVRNVATGDTSDLAVSGVFVAVGLMPNTQAFCPVVDCDSGGYITVDGLMRTPTDGVFAAGDVRSASIRQIAAAVGDGATAAMSAFHYIQER
ncbi:MAG: NAD(P)/FAD-dependent oxidoreductase, partial [Chloroflexota bacterium]